MRIKTVLTAAIIGACSFAALGAPALALGRNNAYQSLALASAEACARACEEDGLCIAWTFSINGACNLAAVAPQQAPSEMKYGLSTRAPSFARAQPTTANPTPEPMMAAEAPAPARAPTTAHANDALSYEEASVALLGGPEEDTLRLRLDRQ